MMEEAQIIRFHSNFMWTKEFWDLRESDKLLWMVTIAKQISKAWWRRFIWSKKFSWIKHNPNFAARFDNHLKWLN